jgi:hypothetical protein
MIGRRQGGFILHMSGSIQRRNLGAAGFARVVGWERIRVLGGRLIGEVQRIVEAMTTGAVAGRSDLGEGRECLSQELA